MTEETQTLFPVKVELTVRLTDEKGNLIRELPLRYTVKSARHWGLLKRAYRTDGTRFLSSPTNKHFIDYAGTIANIVYSALKNDKQRGLVTVSIVGPPLYHFADNHVYIMDAFYQHTLEDFANTYGQGAFYVLRSQIMELLRSAVTRRASVCLRDAGYQAKPKPRKYLHAKWKYWYNYKGVKYAYVRERLALVEVEDGYKGALLELHAVREVLKYAHGTKQILWVVNTPEQAVEAKLLSANSDVELKSASTQFLDTNANQE
jgi:hypothetical protein